MVWVLTFIGVIGVVLNIYKNRWGFFLWMISNTLWAILDFRKGMPEQAVLFIVYFFAALWGWICWSKKSN